MLTTYNNEPVAECILRLPEVMKRTGLSRSTIYARINENSFPKQISLGNRSSGWIESEIRDWITNLIASSRQHIPKPP